MDATIVLTEKEKFMLWRRRNNVKLKDIAKYIGCTEALLSMCETGKANITQSMRQHLIDFMNQYKD